MIAILKFTYYIDFVSSFKQENKIYFLNLRVNETPVTNNSLKIGIFPKYEFRVFNPYLSVCDGRTVKNKLLVFSNSSFLYILIKFP